MEKKISIEVVEIRGTCPVFNVGDRLFIDGPSLVKERTDAVCVHALPSLLHFSMALRQGADPIALGLTKEGDAAYLQCPDPGEPYTNGGTVVFRIEMV
jgi:uncharacterized repeat protein (TIGR04076 family)